MIFREYRGLEQHSLEDERDQSNGFHSNIVLLVQGHGHNAVLQGNSGSVTGHKHSPASRWETRDYKINTFGEKDVSTAP